ncbi:MAG: hypothetical protein Q8Q56_04060, partial [Alphaproteobacteria bacterium]|nr:hypothetical protein [Alphaproteobacteria bacterium]
TVLSFILPALAAADLGVECTIFNVGQGSGAVIRDKHTGTSFIVDAGNSGTKETISPLLRRFNKTVFGKSTARRRLRGVLLSHSDGDHIKLLTCSLQVNSWALKDQNKHAAQRVVVYLGSPFHGYLAGDGEKCLNALIAVNARIRALSHVMTQKQVRDKDLTGCMPQPFFMNVLIPEFSAPYRELKTIIMAANAAHRGVGKFIGTVDAPGALDAAMPGWDTELAGGTNDNGVILKLNYRGRRIVFTGDIDGKGTDRILVETPEAFRDGFLETDVLLAAHHGAERERTNNLAWILTTNPSYVFVSAGERRDYMHPSLSVVFSIASILRLNNGLRVPPHLIQCGDKTEAVVKGCNKLKAHFESPEDIQEKETEGFKWLQLYTPLPIYTTLTTGDHVVALTAAGGIVIY